MCVREIKHTLNYKFCNPISKHVIKVEMLSDLLVPNYDNNGGQAWLSCWKKSFRSLDLPGRKHRDVKTRGSSV